MAAISALGMAACSPDAIHEEVREQIDESAARDALAEPVIDLTVEQLAERIDRGGIRLIDVRTDEEVAEGMIEGAEHISLDQFDPANLDLSDGREVILYCRSGRRSRIAAERLHEHSDRPAAHLAGGIIAWTEAGKPILKP